MIYVSNEISLKPQELLVRLLASRLTLLGRGKQSAAQKACLMDRGVYVG